MNDTRKTWFRGACERLASPTCFLIIAVALAVSFLVFHLLGWREYTSILSGTTPAGGGGGMQFVLGIIYVTAYFAFALASPILVLAGLILAGLLRVGRRRSQVLQKD